MPQQSPPAVALVPVDDLVLAELVRVATTEAAADEVTPRTEPAEPGWTPERVDWLQHFHTERRLGLAGPAGEATWAVVAEGRVVGAVRLQRTADPGVLETGVWLVRGRRGRGVGSAALTAVLRSAELAGASAVRAETTAGNGAARALLGRAGFRLREDVGGAVHAELSLGRATG